MIDRILKLAIAQRHFVLVLTLVGAVIGALALARLPIDAVPDITNKQVQINTVHPGLSPEEIERQITFQVETTLAGIAGLQSTRSLSRDGYSQVTAIFEDEVDIYFARQQISERLNNIRSTLPAGADPKMGPISTGLGEVFMWSVHFRDGESNATGKPGLQAGGDYLTLEGELLTNDVQRLTYLRTLQDWLVRPQLISTIKNIADIEAIGGFVKQYEVQPRLPDLLAHGLTLHDLITALERNNQVAGAGRMEQRGETMLVRVDARVDRREALARVPIAQKRGTPVFIGDVADVVIAGAARQGSATHAGHETVVGTVLMLTGSNSRAVARAVGERLPAVQRSLPPDIVLTPLMDRSRLVNATIATVKHNLFYGAVLVVVVLFALLGHVRAAFVTALAIPLSMLLAATGMVAWGISGNLMSLGAVDFGLIVDGSVIIVENCLRRLAERQRQLGRPLELAERMDVVQHASHEVRRATVFGEAIIIIVYVPILALAGVEGKMFHPMALTVIFALTAAFLLSLTFIPAMVALCVRGRISEKENPLMQVAHRLYEPLLDAALRRRGAVIAIAAALCIGAGVGFTRLGQEFIPTLDEGDIAMHAVRIPGTGLEQATRMQMQLERAVAQMPEVAVVFSKTGTTDLGTDPMPPHVSDTFILFKDRAQWPNPKLSKPELEQRLRAAVADVPGNNYEVTQPIQMRFNELIAGTRSDVAVHVYGSDMDQLREAAARVAQVLQSVPGATDVRVEQTSGMPMLTVRPRADVIARHGLTGGDIVDAVSIAVGGHTAGQLFEGDRRFDIVVRLPESVRTDRRQLEELPVPLPPVAEHAPRAFTLASAPHYTGLPHVLPLRLLAEVSDGEGPFQVSRQNGQRRITVVTNVRGRDLGGFVTAAQTAVVARAALPPGLWTEWGGQHEHYLSARNRLAMVVPICFVLIFMLLHAGLGAAKPALLVFTGVPLALTGGVAALALRGMPFSISAGVGFIAVSGVAVLNGLVLVTFINQMRAQGLPGLEAVRSGALTRLRAVLMTALVAALGFLPMAFASGTGAEVQRPLATVVIGGILSSTALTLLVLPALCAWMFGRKS